MIEDCTIVAPTYPPTMESLELKWKGKEKENEAKEELAAWDNKIHFGDAFFITLSSLPSVPLIVPRDKLIVESTIDFKPLEYFFKDHLPYLIPFFQNIISGLIDRQDTQIQVAYLKTISLLALHSLVKSFDWLATASASVLRTLVDVALTPLPAAKGVKSEPIRIKPILMESAHDYDHNANDFFPIKIPEAKAIKIVFDEETRCEQNYDYMRFYKDDSHTEYYGDEKYTGDI
jgi:hypothetical protein